MYEALLDGDIVVFECPAAQLLTDIQVLLPNALVLGYVSYNHSMTASILRNLHDTQHGGFGSSASLQTAVAIAINNIFGNKIPERDLAKFLAQNYGEECDRIGYLAPMASIGGASAVAIGDANLVVIGGESEVWKTYNLSDEYSVLIITPNLGIERISGASDMQMYKNGYEAFLEMGREWGGYQGRATVQDN